MSRSEAILERLHALHPVAIDLSLGRLEGLLRKLGHPERHLPPVVHVAGTNGKGSTCAFLRAIGEAAGQRVHVFTSPHLVRFHERIRLAGELVGEEALGAALEEIEAVNAGAAITVFEVITAVAFLLFSRVPADLLVLEVGLGGRFDATNVIPPPAVAAITSISMDHMEFLGDRLERIAFEKAGIIKPRVPCVTGAQEPAALGVLERVAAEAGAPLLARGRGWSVGRREGGLRYADAAGVVELPPPGLLGAHQADNAGIAVAALRAWGPGWLSEAALAAGIAGAEWPGRMQRLGGRLAGMLPEGWELWLDGGHNAGGGLAIAGQAREWGDRPLHLLVGMKGTKVVEDFLRPLVPLADSLWAVAEPGQHLATPVERIVAASGGVARPGPTVEAALRALPREGPPARVLVCGSLYLAGEVLKLDGSP
ncbi:bifunctional folylpolyglutamate synthase/dihydrofolate synthase [Belnapia sp. T18]|uniref:Bifunctional folylpolyglutamate synthase/dihydrofolate synthase n=1 Tax=Belnapia arida TaxID=2804533 RepID=A0ABS1UAW6_9PROT|nr:folylpolyglutamate synthase/dihydrofolate synthase family protein [Belnapia arida]MBL6081265.1 bifunctional folylpolyglutamate synthase/dihydrofolate synthase [Belnapia arida]